MKYISGLADVSDLISTSYNSYNYRREGIAGSFLIPKSANLLIFELLVPPRNFGTGSSPSRIQCILRVQITRNYPKIPASRQINNSRNNSVRCTIRREEVRWMRTKLNPLFKKNEDHVWPKSSANKYFTELISLTFPTRSADSRNNGVS